MKRAALFVLVLALVSGISACSQQPQQFTATLQRELVPNPKLMAIISLNAAKPDDLSKFTPALRSPQKILTGELYLTAKLQPKLALVEQGNGDNCVFVDGKQTGKFTSAQSVCLKADAPTERGVLKVQLSGPVSMVPIAFELKRPGIGQESKDLMLTYSSHVMARGELHVAGRAIKFAYDLNLNKEAVDPNRAVTYFDQDGDGTFDMVTERKFAAGYAPTYHVGSLNLYTQSVDLVARKVIWATREASEVHDFDYSKGSVLPDFSFNDFDGKQRVLSSVKGKLILLDFWATWCPPCVEDLPKKKVVYEKWHAQGFEILGIDGDDSPEKPMALAKKLGLAWPEARFDEDLIAHRFFVSTWPTAILLNEKHQVLSADRSKLFGDELEKTVAAALSH